MCLVTITKLRYKSVSFRCTLSSFACIAQPVYMYMYTCMHVYIHMKCVLFYIEPYCTHTYTNTHTYAHKNTDTYIHTYPFFYRYIHTYIHTLSFFSIILLPPAFFLAHVYGSLKLFYYHCAVLDAPSLYVRVCVIALYIACVCVIALMLVYM